MPQEASERDTLSSHSAQPHAAGGLSWRACLLVGLGAVRGHHGSCCLALRAAAPVKDLVVLGAPQGQANRRAAENWVRVVVHVHAARKALGPGPVLGSCHGLGPAERAAGAHLVGWHVLERRLALESLAADALAGVLRAHLAARRVHGVLVRDRSARKQKQRSGGTLHCQDRFRRLTRVREWTHASLV